MPNFLQDVGRSNISSSIRDLVQTKIGLDANARADLQEERQQALSAEQMKILQRQNKALDEKETWENTPIPINAIKDSVEFGAEGPIFKHLYDKTKGLGYIDETNPANPTILRKHLINDVPKLMEQDVLQINNMRIDAYNKELANANAVLAEKPGDKNAQAAKERATTGLMQATMYDSGLKKMAELQNAKDIQAAHDARLAATNAATNAVSMRNADVAAASRVAASTTKADAEAKKEGNKTAMERAWNLKRSEPGSEDLSLEDFKKNHWEKDRPTGELNDNAVLQRIETLAEFNPAKTAQIQKRYFTYKKKGMSSGEAYQKIVDEESAAPVKPSGTKDMSYLWK